VGSAPPLTVIATVATLAWMKLKGAAVEMPAAGG
jgi:hypothetical protein